MHLMISGLFRNIGLPITAGVSCFAFSMALTTLLTEAKPLGCTSVYDYDCTIFT